MIKLLLVDDEKMQLEITKLYLERISQDFEITVCSESIKAFDIIKTGLFDVIVSDYDMPILNGIDLLKAVRADNNQIPFIIFTGRGREEVVIEALNNGVDFYIQKGTDPKSLFAELNHKINQAVRRNQYKNQLDASIQQLFDIFHHLPDPTFVIDNNGTVISWNRAMEEITKIPASEMCGNNDYRYSEVFYGAKRPLLIDHILDPECGGFENYKIEKTNKDIITAETDLAVIDGKPVVLWCKATPMYDTSGNVTGAIESIRDITESKKAEKELRAAHEYMRCLIEAHVDPLITISTDGVITDMNAEFERLMCCSRTELNGRKLESYISGVESFQNVISKAFEEDQVRDVNMMILQKTGKAVPVEFYASVYRNDAAEILGLFAELHVLGEE